MTTESPVQSIEIPEPVTTLDCFSDHVAAWAIEPATADQILSELRDVDISVLVEQAQSSLFGERPSLRERISRVGDVAIVPIKGTITKGKSTLGGTSSVEVRKELDRLANDDSVSNIILQIDSPGGHVAGTPDLAHDVRDLADDPDAPTVTAFVDSLAASAAFWVATQANEVVANNELAEVGSIGVLMVARDTSEQTENSGVRVISMTTGPRKDDFVRGLPIDKETIAHHTSRIVDIKDVFVADVAQGSGLTEREVQGFATGETFLARDAMRHGLVDRVSSLPDLVREMREVDRPRVGASAMTSDFDPEELVHSTVHATLSTVNLLDHAHIEEADVEPVTDDDIEKSVDGDVSIPQEQYNDDEPTEDETRTPMPPEEPDSGDQPDLRSIVREEMSDVLREELASAGLGGDAVREEIQKVRTETQVENKAQDILEEFGHLEGIESKVEKLSAIEPPEVALDLLQEEENTLKQTRSNDVTRHLDGGHLPDEDPLLDLIDQQKDVEQAFQDQMQTYSDGFVNEDRLRPGGGFQ